MHHVSKGLLPTIPNFIQKSSQKVIGGGNNPIQQVPTKSGESVYMPTVNLVVAYSSHMRAVTSSLNSPIALFAASDISLTCLLSALALNS